MDARALRWVARLMIAAGGVSCCVLLGSSGVVADTTHQILVTGGGTAQSPYAYQGVPATVALGDSVSWLNQTSAHHTVAATATPDASFKTTDLYGQGSTFTYTPPALGQYSFHCTQSGHPETMSFTVVAATPPPATQPPPTPTPLPVTPRPAPVPTASHTATPAPTPTPTAAPTATPAPVAEATTTTTSSSSGGTLPTAPSPPAAPPPADTGTSWTPYAVVALIVVAAGFAVGGVLLRRWGH